VGRRIAAWTTFLAALLTLLSAFTPAEPWRANVLSSVEPESLRSLGNLLAAAIALCLIALVPSIAAGTRRAVDIAIPLLAAVAVAHLVKGLDYEESAVAVAVAVLLVMGRRACTRGATSRPGLVAGGVAVASVSATYAISIATSLLGGPDHGVRSALGVGVSGAATGSWFLRSGTPLAVVLDLAVAAGILAAAVFVRGLLRPEPWRDGHRRDEHESAAAIVASYGDDSLDPFALREDKSFFFAQGGVLAYRVLRETAVVSGDPIGPPGTHDAILAGFLEHAHDQGWQVTVAAASERYVAGYRRLGLRALKVGEEAVVDPRRFSLEGRRIRKVRQSVARVERHGWTSEVRRAAQLGTGDWRDIVALEDEWRAAQRRVHGFAMTLGRLGGAAEDLHMLYVLARRPDGRVGALLRLAPYSDGLSLDAMRRGAGTPSGVTEALVVRTLAHARDEGAAEVSLNFAGFGHIMAEGRDLGGVQQLARVTLGLFHSRFQLERLTAFNQKFDPRWRARYLVYGGRLQLPRAGLRVLQAEAYIPCPRSEPLPARWVAAPEPA
jgi:lysyl-tRNA synthetase, class II